jgi:hypothetical protein
MITLFDQRSKQQRNWDILKNRHETYIRRRILSTVTNADNQANLLLYLRRFGNPARKIVRFLSSVHSRPVCRTTDEDKLDERFWENVDLYSLESANRHAEYFANGCGDAFIYIYMDTRAGKVKFRFYAAHEVDIEWDGSGGISVATLTTASGRLRLDYLAGTMQIGDAAPVEMGYNPLIHYRLDETEPEWSVDLAEPVFDVTIEIGNQICLFLESGYMRSHEQLALDAGAGDVPPGDVGDVELGSRKIVAFPIKAVPLVSSDTAEKFFQSIENLAIFAAEQEGIPAAYFNQTQVNTFPPDLRDRWEIDCAKWRARDLDCLLEAGKLLKLEGLDWDPETEWTVIYQEPRGMVPRKEQLDNLEKEISLGLTTPDWFLFATDGDFRTLGQASKWVDDCVVRMGEINLAKAERNLALENGAAVPTPRENGAAGGALSAAVRAGGMDDDYDGNAGPRPVPGSSFPK